MYAPIFIFTFFHPITSRDVNEARRPHTCSRPCGLEEKKTKKKKSRRTQTTPASKRIFLVLEPPYGPASCHEHQRRYVRHGDCATHRAATRLPAGIEGVRTHASTSLLRTSAGVLCLASNGDWWWTMCSNALEAWKTIEVGFVRSKVRLAWAVSYSYRSNDGMILKWEHNKWYTWCGSVGASSRRADSPAVAAPSPSRH